MQYLARFHDRDELARVHTLLRSKGVPTWAETVEGRRLGWQGTLHVCIDAQRDDALHLLRDPDHAPAHPVDAEAFEHAMAQGDGSASLVRSGGLGSVGVTGPLFSGMASSIAAGASLLVSVLTSGIAMAASRMAPTAIRIGRR